MRVTAATGRHGDVRVLNFSLDQDAAAILDKYAPPRLRARGRFLSRLLFEFEAREEERAQLLHTCKTRHEGRPEDCHCPLQHLREGSLLISRRPETTNAPAMVPRRQDQPPCN